MCKKLAFSLKEDLSNLYKIHDQGVAVYYMVSNLFVLEIKDTWYINLHKNLQLFFMKR